VEAAVPLCDRCTGSTGGVAWVRQRVSRLACAVDHRGPMVGNASWRNREEAACDRHGIRHCALEPELSELSENIWHFKSVGATRKATGKQCPGRTAIVGDEEVHGGKPPARIFEGESQMAQLLDHDLRRLDPVRTQLSC
jgi:hypothetical protein